MLKHRVKRILVVLLLLIIANVIGILLFIIFHILTDPGWSSLHGWIGLEIDGFDVNLVLSGHYHGGQWIIPLLGGIYAPGVGFNPPYYKGMFEGTKATCILSAGLGNEYGIIPRINNPPEIVVVDVLPE